MKARSKQTKVPPSYRQRVMLAVERLEDRMAPVIGNGAGPPAAIAAGAVIAVGAPAGEFDHVVHTRTLNLEEGSGALLTTQRHVLAVAHTIDGSQTAINFHMVRNRGGAAVQVPITFTLPADATMNRWQVRHPGYVPPGPGVPQAINDIGIFRLTDQLNPAADRYVIGPVGLNNLRGYAISSVDPVGQVANLAGYGETGIGNWGNSREAVQRLTFNNVPAVAGNFTLSFTRPAGVAGPAVQVTGNINAVGLTAAGLASALEALPALAPIPGVGGAPPTRQVEVHKGNDTQFAIRFIGPNIGGQAIALMVATVAPGQGAFGVVPGIIWAGGFTAAKRTGEQMIERVLGVAGVPAAVAANYVEADFDNGAAAQNSLGGLGLLNEGMTGVGDSGGPAFRRNNASVLEIIGINQGVYRTASPPDFNNWLFSDGNPGITDSSFGEFSVFTAARNFNNAGGFIDTITNNQPYDLILDMRKQVIGADLAGENVTITVQKVGADVVIEVTDPLGAYSGVYYRDALNRIRSLVIRGTNDNETVNAPNNLFGPGKNVRFEGGAGNDTFKLVRLEAGNGGDWIAFNGGDGDDTLIIEDQLGNAGLAYLVSGSSVTAADLSIDEYDGTEHLMLLAGGFDDTFSVSGLYTQTTLLQGGAGNDIVTLDTSSTVTGLTIDGGPGWDGVIVAQGLVSTPEVQFVGVEDLDTNGGAFAPGGLSAAEIFQIAGNYTQASVGALYLEVGIPTTNSDKLLVSGSVNLDGTLILNTLPGFSGGAFTLIDNTGSGSVVGTFSGLAEGAIFRVADWLYQITYVSGDGNDVVLNPVVSGQWANGVVNVSSEFNASPGDWSAAKALGAPDVFAYGDNPKAWSPSSLNGTQEFITLSFPNAVYAQGVTIRETYGNGFVTRIDLIDVNGTPHTIWTGTDPTQPGRPGELTLSFAPANYAVDKVKIYVNTNNNPSTWEQIDAVILYGQAGGGGGFAPSGGGGGLASAVTGLRLSSLRRPSAGPSATLSVTGPVTRGVPVTFQFSSPSGGSGFRYSFDFNNDGDFTDTGEVVDSTSPSTRYTFRTRGWQVIRGRVRGPDGLFTDYWLRVFVS